MNDQLMIPPPTLGIEVRFTDSAVTRKQDAIEACALIARVSNEEENALAVSAQRMACDLKREVEKARKAAKAPVLALGKRIDAACEQFLADLAREELRIATLVGDYQQEILERQRAEQRRIAEEQAKIERLRQEEEARIRREQEEAARLAREKLEAELRAAKDAQAAEAARKRAAEAEEAAKQAAELARKQAEEEAAFRAQCITPSAAAPVRAEGQRVVTDWEITGLNEWVLARARPDLVRRIEFDRLAIKEELKRGVKLPGVTAREVVNSTVRAGAKKEIEV